MIKPTNKYVAQVLREKKLFNSDLNNKNTSDWNANHYHEWAQITGQKSDYTPTPKRVSTYVRKGGTKAVKVMRIADGKIFCSVTECIEKEGFYKTLMEHLLREEITYKRLRN